MVTETSCVLTSDFFAWSAAVSKKNTGTGSSTATKSLGVKRSFPVSDLTQVDLFDVRPRRLRLTLNGEAESAISLSFETEATLLEAMGALREAWEGSRKMDIEVRCFLKELPLLED